MHWRWIRFRQALGRKLHWPSRLAHAPVPLDTPTYDGSGQVTHPDVLDFGSPWQGHRFWMVTTPYPFLDDTLENPSILVSQDGISWQPPVGLTNPLVEAPSTGFHADPDMIWHRQSGELWLYYLHTIRHDRQYLMRLRSADGIHWGEPETILELPYQTIRSPALLQQGDEIWIWTVNMRDGPKLEFRRSHDGVAWQEVEPVVLELPGYNPSHIDLIREGTAGPWHMVMQAEPKRGGPNVLFWLVSEDPHHWRGGRRPLLSPHDAPLWAAQTLYRSSMTLHRDEPFARLWYAGRSPANENRIAYREVPRSLLHG
uniref:Sialidase domain-containing protein n=1 Tax=Magnetococcus massalia (strain MO-1) TaxID=451514 RepID=A0A1S7LMZ1_MAGMO|nr:conserved protein of unknown function [Candidatus Magnetococcus massalia]